jgi:hypothetical protein
MKKMIILALGMMLSMAGFSQALATQPSKTQVPASARKADSKASTESAKVDKNVKEAKSQSDAGERKLKADGTPDKRYKENKHLKKDGTPDKRYKEHKGKN